MSVEANAAPISETAILSRLIPTEDDALTADGAEALLRIRFDPADLERIHDLLERNRDDSIRPEDRAELESYRRVSFLLDLMHSRARLALKKHRARS